MIGYLLILTAAVVWLIALTVRVDQHDARLDEIEVSVMQGVPDMGELRCDDILKAAGQIAEANRVSFRTALRAMEVSLLDQLRQTVEDLYAKPTEIRPGVVELLNAVQDLTERIERLEKNTQEPA